MAILPHLGDENTRSTAIVLLKRIRHGKCFDDGVGHGAGLPLVDTGYGFDFSAMAIEHLLHRVGHFAHGGPGAGCIHTQGEQIAVCGSAIGERSEGSIRGGLITLGAQFFQLRELLLAHGGVVDLQDVNRLLALGFVAIDPDDRLPSGIDPRLGFGSRFLDPHFRDALFDGFGHPTEAFDLFDMLHRAGGEIGGQPFHEVGAAPGIDHAGGARLLLQEKLRVAGNAGGKVGGQRESLIQRIGMQALRVALRRRHRLNAGADHIVEHILCRERPAGRL